MPGAIAAALALLALVLKKWVIPRTDALGSQIQLADMAAIPGFRKLHLAVILINIAQLAAIVWSLITFSQ